MLWLILLPGSFIAAVGHAFHASSSLLVFYSEHRWQISDAIGV